MDLIFVALAAVLMLVGILGSFLPMLPGIPVSWLGLLLLHFTTVIPFNYTYLGVTLLITIIIFALQYAIPALGTKYLGGSKQGMFGATIGLFAGIFIPIPFAILITPFVGAYLGEIMTKADSRTALRAASGSFIGLLASTFMEFIVTAIFFFLFLFKVWEYKAALFAF